MPEILLLLIGLLIGWLIGIRLKVGDIYGDINVVDSDGTKYLYLELYKEEYMETMLSKNIVLFKVKHGTQK